jgi:molybdopterin-binding protein
MKLSARNVLKGLVAYAIIKASDVIVAKGLSTLTPAA